MWNLPWTGDQTYVPCIGRQVLNQWTTREVLKVMCLFFPLYCELPIQVMASWTSCSHSCSDLYPAPSFFLPWESSLTAVMEMNCLFWNLLSSLSVPFSLLCCICLLPYPPTRHFFLPNPHAPTTPVYLSYRPCSQLVSLLEMIGNNSFRIIS